MDWLLFTPLDIERRVGLTDGNIHHLDMVPSQLFANRPLPGWSDYRTPIQDLWLCGAGTHPGGEVSRACRATTPRRRSWPGGRRRLRNGSGRHRIVRRLRDPFEVSSPPGQFAEEAPERSITEWCGTDNPARPGVDPSAVVEQARDATTFGGAQDPMSRGLVQ